MTGLLAGIFTADPSGMEGTGGGEQLDPHLHLLGLDKLFMPNISLLTLGGSKTLWCYWRQAVLGVAVILPRG